MTQCMSSHKIYDSFCLKSAEKSIKTRICVAVVLEDAESFTLPFRASGYVGLSEAGQAYVCEMDGRGVLALQLSGTGEWRELWRRDRPSDIGSKYPYIAASAPDTSTAFCLMQDYRDAPTVAMDGNGEVSRTQREGTLLTCLASNRAVYQRWREEDGRGLEIVIWSGDDCVTLRPPADQEWSHRLSVCEDGARLAVVDYSRPSPSPNTLYIFLQQQRK
jgi:hypothetical protein